MSTPDLGERNYDLSGYSREDRRFFEQVQDRLDKRPLADKIRGAVPKILLASSVGILALGSISGSKEIFAGGFCLYTLMVIRQQLMDAFTLNIDDHSF